MGIRHVQIGEVAARTELSLRTIRYYEEMGLVKPAARTSGGFRLYAEADISRLLLIKRMKPLEFSLDEMRDVLDVLDRFDDADLDMTQHVALVERLEMYREAAQARVRALQEQLTTAEQFAADLRREIGRQKRSSTRQSQ